jgi:hypothetical protein
MSFSSYPSLCDDCSHENAPLHRLLSSPTLSAPSQQEDGRHQLITLLYNIAYTGLGAVVVGVAYATVMLSIIGTVYPLPGHDTGGVWPLYVTEHASEATSQNLLDPYSFAHATHGVIGYLATIPLGLGPGDGLILTLVTALLWEMLENTNLIIQLFRDHSGPSEFYVGDSRINVAGDVIACGVGFTLAHVAADWAGLWLPVAWILASEVVLGVTIRDNMFLMGLQLVAPSQSVKQWQGEILTREEQQRRDAPDGGYWTFRFRSRKYGGDGPDWELWSSNSSAQQMLQRHTNSRRNSVQQHLSYI